MPTYPNPPSDHLLRHGAVIRESHHLCKGIVRFDEVEVACHFEVGYTDKCSIIVVLYLSTKEQMEVFGHKLRAGGQTRYSFPSNRNYHIATIDGRDQRTGETVTLNECALIDIGDTFFHTDDDGRPPAYVARTMTVVRDVPPNDIVPLPRFGLNNVEIGATFEPDVPFGPEDGTVRSMVLLRNTDLEEASARHIPSTLYVLPQQTPAGFTEEALANLWCIAASLALGRTIVWCYAIFADPIREVWQYRTGVESEGTSALIKVRQVSHGSEFTEFVWAFIEAAVRRQLTEEFIVQLGTKVKSHISHRIAVTHIIDQLRLVTTSTEELLDWVTQELNIAVESPISEQNHSAFLDALKQWLNESLATTITDRADRGFIKKRLIYLTRKELARLSLKVRLDKVLSNSTALAEWYELFGAESTTEFETLRNFVAHRGQFPYDDSTRNSWLYWNAVMMFPRIIFAVLEFPYIYRDLSVELNRGTPRLPSHGSLGSETRPSDGAEDETDTK